MEEPVAKAEHTAKPVGATRRGGLGHGLKLAVAAPAALAALPAGTAAADSDHGKWGSEVAREAREAAREAIHEAQADVRELRARLREELREEFGTQGFRRVGFRARRFGLGRVADVPSGDFDKANQGGDPLDRGGLGVLRAEGDQAGTVFVRLRGAAQNATYAVIFARFNDKGRETIGQVTTDGDGDFGGQVAAAGGGNGRLSGDNRVGIFVLTRDGKDQFITSIPVTGA
ncbi:MAG: hypothetical protein ACRDI2_18170 [Chloroflexota bacterium]